MPSIRVLFIAPEQFADKIAPIASPNLNDGCEKQFVTLHHYDEKNLAADLAQFRPHAVIADLDRSADEIALDIHKQFLARQKPPVVSVFTPTYNTDTSALARAYVSLKEQSFTDWEWVLYDDSTSDDTFKLLCAFAGTDPRLRVYRGKHSGSIGEVKRNAVSLCRGEIFVELDHDDELTTNCLTHLVAAFAQYPDAGFAYTGCVEWENGGSRKPYPDGWGWGYGRHERQVVKGIEVDSIPPLPINGKTIRYITACPNHARAWRRETYWAAGGHNPKYDVGDDYELMVRTFLITRMIRVNYCGYVQHFHGNNSQTSRLHEIQRIVLLTVRHYNEQIKQRFRDLGAVDCALTDDGLTDFGNPCDVPHNVSYEYFPGQPAHQLAIVTACTRPENIEVMHQSLGSIPIHWIIVEDASAGKKVVPPANSIHKITLLSFLGAGLDHAGGQCCKNRGLEFVLNTSKEPLVYFLDDDNILYPGFVDQALRLAHERPEPLIVFQQVLEERPDYSRLVRPIDIRVHFIDQAQYLLKTSCIGTDRIPLDYCGDGMFAETLAQKYAVYMCHKPLCFYNWIHS